MGSFFEQPRHINPDKVFFLYKEKIGETLESFEKLAVARMRTVPHVLCLEKIARSLDRSDIVRAGMFAVAKQEKDFATAHILDDIFIRYSALRRAYDERTEEKLRRVEKVNDNIWFREEVKKLFLNIPPDKIEAVNTFALTVFYEYFLQPGATVQEKVSPEAHTKISLRKQEWERTILAMSRESRLEFLAKLQKIFIYSSSGFRMPSVALVSRALEKCGSSTCESVPDDLLSAIVYNIDQESLTHLLRQGKEMLKGSVDSHCEKVFQGILHRFSLESIKLFLESLEKRALGSFVRDISPAMFDQAKRALLDVVTEGVSVSLDGKGQDFFAAYNAILQYIVYSVSREKTFRRREVVAHKPTVAGQRVNTFPSEAELQEVARNRALEEIAHLGYRLGAEKIDVDDIGSVKRLIEGLKKDRRFCEFSSKDWELVEDIFCAQNLTNKHTNFIDANLELLREIYVHVEPLYSVGKSTPILPHFRYPKGRLVPRKPGADDQGGGPRKKIGMLSVFIIKIIIVTQKIKEKSSHKEDFS